MESIFINNKNTSLATIISSNPTNSYKLVDTWLTENRKWFSGYCKHRTSKGADFAKRNDIIWELINMINDPDDSDEFEM